MLLPRDMQTLEDCLCPGNVTGLHDVPGSNPSLFRCPTGSTATQLNPLSFADCACLAGYTRDDTRKRCTSEQFQCVGRYKLKPGLSAAASLADCDCSHPYKKDEATGRCALHKCPRAGNYVKKTARRHVTSLADCACIAPYTKNDQSGECFIERPYACPPSSTPLPGRRPQSFADCSCDWGFVRSKSQTCERESAAFACPVNSVKRRDLPIGEHAQSFADCVCLQTGEYVRNEATHSCDEINKKKKKEKKDTKNNEGEDEDDGDEDGSAYTCPPFSVPLASQPHSVEQCECVAGYGWKTPEMVCVPLSAYRCPPHAFRPPGRHVEASFADCECARGFFRDDGAGRCLEWMLANDNGCPAYAFLRHWPLQSRANCQCIYGRAPAVAATTAPETPAPTEDRRQQLRQRKTRREPSTSHSSRQCLPPPEDSGLQPGDGDDETTTSRASGPFSQCPPGAVAINWPVASADDCACRVGFEEAPLSDADKREGNGFGFRCVDSRDRIADAQDTNAEEDDEEEACEPPRVASAIGGCRLPLEIVRPSEKAKEVAKAAPRVVFRGIEYEYVLTDDDIMIIQGDVAIGELKRWPTTVPVVENGDGGGDVEAPDAAVELAFSHVLHGYFNAERDHRWRDGEMCFELTAGARAFERVVLDAMAHITQVTNFQFRRCFDDVCAMDDACSHDFVSVRETASSCFSYVGRIGGPQPLGVSAECGLGNVMHVLLHAVGLRHTQDREDRDEHLRVAWECLPARRRSDLVVEQPLAPAPSNDSMAAPMDTPYDFFSIMHAPADAFLAQEETEEDDAEGEETTAPPPPAWCQSLFPIIADPLERLLVLATMGQRELLAVTDIHAVWRLYPQLQVGDAAATTDAMAVTQPQDAVHESRLHSVEDVVGGGGGASIPSTVDGLARRRRGSGKSSLARRLRSFVGGVVLLVGFGAFLAFGVSELRKRQLRGADAFYYSESLLSDDAAKYH
ncbi:hypothetical protein PINS_up007969 [Pythium insidiosum]|nr:hypothetical protein PINS_up007969 [Pythium insidiosum]